MTPKASDSDIGCNCTLRPRTTKRSEPTHERSPSARSPIACPEQRSRIIRLTLG
jgi:hypothetical protein